jgi:lipoate-protein ligase A
MAKTAKQIRLIDLGETDWWQTQAVYHALAERVRSDASDVVILCRPRSPYLCLGYHQVYDEIFDREKCNQMDLPVLRRRLGGGATYLDRNQLFYQFIFHKSRVPVMPERMYANFLTIPVTALRACGIAAQLVGLNEIEVDQKRIAGIGGGNINEASVVVGNFLFDFDFEKMLHVWRVPNAEFGQMAANSLRNRIVTLHEFDKSLMFDKVRDSLLTALHEAFGSRLVTSTLSLAETVHAEMVYKKLTSDKFLSLHTPIGKANPMTSLKISAREQIEFASHRQNGLLVSGSFRVCDGVISESRLQGEPAQDLEKMETALCGTAFEAWRGVAESFL